MAALAALAGIREELTCLLCKLPMKNPQTFNTMCGHTFCRECVINTLEGPGIVKSQCPACKQPAWKKDLHTNHKYTAIAEAADHMITLVHQEMNGTDWGPTANTAAATNATTAPVMTGDPAVAAANKTIVEHQFVATAAVAIASTTDAAVQPVNVGPGQMQQQSQLQQQPAEQVIKMQGGQQLSRQCCIGQQLQNSAQEAAGVLQANNKQAGQHAEQQQQQLSLMQPWQQQQQPHLANDGPAKHAMLLAKDEQMPGCAYWQFQQLVASMLHPYNNNINRTSQASRTAAAATTTAAEMAAQQQQQLPIDLLDALQQLPIPEGPLLQQLQYDLDHINNLLADVGLALSQRLQHPDQVQDPVVADDAVAVEGDTAAAAAPAKQRTPGAGLKDTADSQGAFSAVFASRAADQQRQCKREPEPDPTEASSMVVCLQESHELCQPEAAGMAASTATLQLAAVQQNIVAVTAAGVCNTAANAAAAGELAMAPEMVKSGTTYRARTAAVVDSAAHASKCLRLQAGGSHRNSGGYRGSGSGRAKARRKVTRTSSAAAGSASGTAGCAASGRLAASNKQSVNRSSLDGAFDAALATAACVANRLTRVAAEAATSGNEADIGQGLPAATAAPEQTLRQPVGASCSKAEFTEVSAMQEQMCLLEQQPQAQLGLEQQARQQWPEPAEPVHKQQRKYPDEQRGCKATEGLQQEQQQMIKQQLSAVELPSSRHLHQWQCGTVSIAVHTADESRQASKSRPQRAMPKPSIDVEAAAADGGTADRANVATAAAAAAVGGGHALRRRHNSGTPGGPTSDIRNASVKVMDDSCCHKLVGQRVAVFWPEDNAYYNGVVTAYNSSKGTHAVLYDDGEVEPALNLDKEIWHVVVDADQQQHSKAPNSTSEQQQQRKQGPGQPDNSLGGQQQEQQVGTHDGTKTSSSGRKRAGSAHELPARHKRSQNSRRPAVSGSNSGDVWSSSSSSLRASDVTSGTNDGEYHMEDESPGSEAECSVFGAKADKAYIVLESHCSSDQEVAAAGLDDEVISARDGDFMDLFMGQQQKSSRRGRGKAARKMQGQQGKQGHKGRQQHQQQTWLQQQQQQKFVHSRGSQRQWRPRQQGEWEDAIEGDSQQQLMRPHSWQQRMHVQKGQGRLPATSRTVKRKGNKPAWRNRRTVQEGSTDPGQGGTDSWNKEEQQQLAEHKQQVLTMTEEQQMAFAELSQQLDAAALGLDVSSTSGSSTGGSQDGKASRCCSKGAPSNAACAPAESQPIEQPEGITGDCGCWQLSSGNCGCEQQPQQRPQHQQSIMKGDRQIELMLQEPHPACLQQPEQVPFAANRHCVSLQMQQLSQAQHWHTDRAHSLEFRPDRNLLSGSASSSNDGMAEALDGNQQQDGKYAAAVQQEQGKVACTAAAGSALKVSEVHAVPESAPESATAGAALAPAPVAAATAIAHPVAVDQQSLVAISKAVVVQRSALHRQPSRMSVSASKICKQLDDNKRQLPNQPGTCLVSLPQPAAPAATAAVTGTWPMQQKGLGNATAVTDYAAKGDAAALQVALLGFTAGKMLVYRRQLQGLGAKATATVEKVGGTHCLMVPVDAAGCSSAPAGKTMIKALLAGTPVVSQHWLEASLAAGALQDVQPYIVQSLKIQGKVHHGTPHAALAMHRSDRRLFEGLTFMVVALDEQQEQHKQALEYLLQLGGASLLKHNSCRNQQQRQAGGQDGRMLVLICSSKPQASTVSMLRRQWPSAELLAASYMSDCVHSFEVLDIKPYRFAV